VKRNPWVAALLTVLAPGLGHIYVGEARRGLLGAAAIGVVVLAVMLPVRAAPWNLLVPILGALAIYAWLLVDAFRAARRLGEAYEPRWYNRWFIYAVLFTAMVGLSEARRVWLFEIFPRGRDQVLIVKLFAKPPASGVIVPGPADKIVWSPDLARIGRPVE
jgi:hypothetical protein